MTSLKSHLELIGATDPPIVVQAFGSMLDAQWLEDACAHSSQYTIRRRKLPVEKVIWLVLGMGLYRDEAIVELARTIGLARSGRRKSADIASSSVTDARKRLGAEPMRHLFKTAATYWASELADAEPKWFGFRTFALDGTTLDVPDSDGNRREFGGPSNQHGPTGYPKVRVMVMLATGSHLMVDAVFAGYSGKGTGEKSLMSGMASRLPDDSVLLFDAGLFHSAELWAHQSSGQNRHWLGAIKSDLKYSVIEKLDEGDVSAQFRIPKKVRAKHPGMPEVLQVRVIDSVGANGKVLRLMTSLIDPEQYPAKELRRLYADRWEIELGYRETKTYLLERSTPLRSKKPDGVGQELWGILLAYNLIRYRMAVAATKSGVRPLQLSFKHCIFHIRTYCTAMFWMRAPSKFGKLLDDLDEALSTLLLPPPHKRKKRSYPREVKQHKKTYPIKRRQGDNDAQA